MFNLVKFDPTRQWSLNELKDGKKVGNFFGPFFDSQEGAMYFFSPRDAVEFDIGAYEYEEEDTSVVEGHVFGLVTVRGDETPANLSRSHSRTHYRMKKNMGARLANVWFANLTSRGEITFEYAEGDICEGETRFSTRITFVCDKSEQSMSHVTHRSSNASRCINNFEWRSPYACSQCKLNETVKYVVLFIILQI